MKTPFASNNNGRRKKPLRALKTPLLLLSKQQKFERIEEILMTIKATDMSEWLDDFSPVQQGGGGAGLRQALWGSSMLHLVLEYKPPASLIHCLILKLRELKPGYFPEDAADYQGKTPLHRAVVACCDVSVIERLTKGVVTETPAATKDSSQRFPLHWACANPKGRNSRSLIIIITAKYNQLFEHSPVRSSIQEVRQHGCCH